MQSSSYRGPGLGGELNPPYWVLLEKVNELLELGSWAQADVEERAVCLDEHAAVSWVAADDHAG
jgi:hypothetical protein